MGIKSTFLLILLTGFSVYSFAQSSNLPNKDIYTPPVDFPQSPQAANLFEFAPYEMDKPSGTANINIPFHTIKAGHIIVPISISYRTNGIRVQDIASGVGLGWNLNAASCITVNEENTAYPYSLRAFKTEPEIALYPTNATLNDEIFKAFNGYYPSLRTIYNFSCGSYMGSFFYDDNLQLKIISPEKRLKITAITSSGQNPTSSKVVSAFKIITPDGLEYIFDQKETSLSMQTTYPGTGEASTAFWVSSITDLSTGKSVGFSYRQKADQVYNNTESFSVGSTYQYITGGGLPGPSVNWKTQYFLIKALQLAEISFPGGKVRLVTEDSRPELDKTKIRFLRLSSGSAIVKEMIFHQGYFDGARLKLDSLTVSNFYSNTHNNFERFKFKYNPTLLPQYKTTAFNTTTNAGKTDYWGYYNGKGNGPGISQKVAEYYNGLNLNLAYTRSFSVDPNLSQASALTEITYPTGGTAAFEYENHILPQGYGSLTDTLGGLRIKSIQYYPSQNHSLKLKKTYKYFEGERLSPHLPNTYSFRSKKNYVSFTDYPYPGYENSSYYLDVTIYENPLVPIVYYNGSPVFYKKVEEYNESVEGDNNGKIASSYRYFSSTMGEYYGVSSPQYGGYKYIYNADHIRGQLLTNVSYKNVGGSYLPVKKDSISYLINKGIFPWESHHVGLLISKKSDLNTSTFATAFEYVGPRATSEYLEVSGGSTYNLDKHMYTVEDVFVTPISVLPSESETVIYDPGSTDSIANKVKYFYDNLNNNNVTRMESTTSEGKLKKTVFKYVDDELIISDVTNNESIVFGFLKELNRISEVIEKDEYIDGVLVGRIRNFYKASYSPILSRNIPQIDRSKKSMFNSGIETSNITYYLYDDLSNVIQKKNGNKQPESFLYDNIGENIIAQSDAEWKDIAFTSFEPNAAGRWIFDKNSCINVSNTLTGKYIFALTSGNSIQITITDAKPYVLSYWSQNGPYGVSGSQVVSSVKTINGWTLYEHNVQASANSTIVISGTGNIDELRLYPMGSSIITYTLDPLIGVTSIGDSKSYIEYYRYDNLGRLNHIIDENGKVVKRICYNYYGQVTDCGDNTSEYVTPYWLPTSEVRCVQTEPGYNTGEQEREEVDNNSSSSTYNQRRWVNIGANTNSCPIGNVNPDWRRTGYTRCSSDPYGYVEQEEKDYNAISPSFNNVRWSRSIYDTMACPIPRYNFTVTNLTNHIINITVNRYGTGQIMGTYQVPSGQTRVIDSYYVDFYTFLVSDGNATSAQFKLSINGYVQPVTNNTLAALKTNSPLTLKVEYP